MRNTVKRTKSQAPDWDKIFAKDVSEKGILAKIYKEILKLNNRKIRNSAKKWAIPLQRHPTEEDRSLVKIPNNFPGTQSLLEVLWIISASMSLHHHIRKMSVKFPQSSKSYKNHQEILFTTLIPRP